MSAKFPTAIVRARVPVHTWLHTSTGTSTAAGGPAAGVAQGPGEALGAGSESGAGPFISRLCCAHGAGFAVAARFLCLQQEPYR